MEYANHLKEYAPAMSEAQVAEEVDRIRLNRAAEIQGNFERRKVFQCVVETQIGRFVQDKSYGPLFAVLSQKNHGTLEVGIHQKGFGNQDTADFRFEVYQLTHNR